MLLFLLTPVWISLHFYWVQKALHWYPLYKFAEALHHLNVNVGPWSDLSMHPLKHIMFFSSILIHFIIPMHPLHILFYMQHQSFTAVTSHTGFEHLFVWDKKQLALGTFHDQMHRQIFSSKLRQPRNALEQVFWLIPWRNIKIARVTQAKPPKKTIRA